MAKSKKLPTQEYLKERFDYNSETGELRWKRYGPYENWNARFAGKLAGRVRKLKNGYQQCNVAVKDHYTGDCIEVNVARVIWKIMTGEDPENYVIDHINRDSADHRWDNLRKVSNTKNSRNSSRRQNNLSGMSGVCWFKKTQQWRARVTLGGKGHHLGLYDYNDLDLAIMEVMEFRLEHSFEPTHGMSFNPNLGIDNFYLVPSKEYLASI